MGFGSGSPRSRSRALRLALLAVALLAALLFHGRGRAYEGVRIVYWVAVAGFLVARLSGRARRQGPPGQGLGTLPWGRGRFGPPPGPLGGGTRVGAARPEAFPPPGVDPDGPRTAERWPPPDPAVFPVDPPLGPAQNEA